MASRRPVTVLVSLGALAAACTGRLDVASPPGPSAGEFETVSTATSVGKVKNLLVGLPPTDAELQAVGQDPGALRGLVQQWVATPQYAAKLQTFFAQAFQQNQSITADYTDQLGANAEQRLDVRLLANLRDSFARTAIELVNEGQPFTSTLTTERFMLTPRLMAMYAFMDAIQVTDANGTTDLYQKAHPTFSFTLTAAKGPIPVAQSIDPTSPNYMIWYAPQLAAAYDSLCPHDPLVYNGGAGQATVTQSLYNMLQGQPQAFNVTVSGGMQHRCQPPNFPAANMPLTVADTQTWKMVNVRRPRAGETTTPVFALDSFRAGNDLVLGTPRVGFFTTPSFLAEWNTNNSNQARVTLNQTLIVSLGHAVSPSNAALPPSIAAVDQAHAPQGSACFACHQSLDPMRQYFRQQYSYFFHGQTIAAETSLPGSFGFRGVTAAGGTIFDLAARLAAHPDFAMAWTQRLCTWANSSPCLTTDPEMVRIASVFAANNFDWGKLVVELFSSPLVSYAARTDTSAQAGEVFPVARRDHLCATLGNRLGIDDVCGLDVNTVLPKALQPVQFIAGVLPSDQYSRGTEEPVLANDPNLFFRAGLENLCAALAMQLIDNNTTWQSSNPSAAISDFVHVLMGIEKARDATPLAILSGHFASAQAAGVTASYALKSTFVLACLSPSIAGIGQ